MGDWNRPRHLVLAVSSKIKVMCHSCIFIVFLIQCIPSHLQHNIIECMRGVYVLAKHSSYHFVHYHFLHDLDLHLDQDAGHL